MGAGQNSRTYSRRNIYHNNDKLFRFDVLVFSMKFSDRCSSGKSVDVSGQVLKTLLESNESCTAVVDKHLVVPDNYDEIVDTLKKLSSECSGIDVVITTGGTGFAVTDVIPEAVRAVCHRRANGLEVALIVQSLKSTPLAALSRLACGIRKHTVIISLPGSAKAVEVSIEGLSVTVYMTCFNLNYCNDFSLLHK
ncbi:unnamed protein product [Soboliphyme baturini]|uniref:molybdopterin molybdotransferase n=1 Tax=Soboliphyme baturini TaxID=241478 RepID=A0A183J3F6_9BILA|nr:unnamed protein product [Soboliphyme baturini]